MFDPNSQNSETDTLIDNQEPPDTPPPQSQRHANFFQALSSYSQTHPESPRDVPQWLSQLIAKNGPTRTPPEKLYVWTPANVGNESREVAFGEQERELGFGPQEERELGFGLQEERELGLGLQEEWREDDESSISEREHNPDRVYIIGAGNLGRLFAAAISQHPSPPPITLVVHRPELLTQWAARPWLSFTPPNSTPLHFPHINVELWSPTPPPVGPLREVGNGNTLERVIVATRASEAVVEADRVRRYLDRQSTVLFAQNGMCRLWPPDGAYYTALRFAGNPDARPNYGVIVTTHGVTSNGPFDSVHASWGEAIIGPVLFNESKRSPQASPNTFSDPSNLIPLLTTLTINGTSTPSYDLWMRQLDKLVVNAVINPLTALLRCRNGILFDRAADLHGPVNRLIQIIVFEAWLVIQRYITSRALYRLVKEYEASSPSVIPLNQRFSYDNILARVHAVGAQVRENTSSMLQHIIAAKPTEVRDFNGWIVDTAHAVHLRKADVVVNARIVELVEARTEVSEDELVAVFGLDEQMERVWGTVGYKIGSVEGRVRQFRRQSAGKIARK